MFRVLVLVNPPIMGCFELNPLSINAKSHSFIALIPRYYHINPKLRLSGRRAMVSRLAGTAPAKQLIDWSFRQNRLTRATTLLTLACLLAIRGFSAGENNQLDSSIQLYTVMAAINAAGFDAGLDSALYKAQPRQDSPNIAPLRLQVRKALEGKNLPVISELKKIYEQHKPRHSEADDFSQYVSLALSINGPPDFGWKGRQVDTPPDAVALDDFRSMLEDFYEQAGIEDLWQRSQPALNHMIEVYHSPVSKMAFDISAYLRMPLSGLMDRRFQIYVDALGPPNYVQGRAYGNTYYVILTPSVDTRLQDIRHSFLRFCIDPIGIKYGLALMQKRSLLDIAVSAPALPEIYKNDFVLLATESLIKAIEARLDRTPQTVTSALQQGFVLTPFFSEELPVFEKQQQALRIFFPDIIDAIDLKRETDRLQNVKFAVRSVVEAGEGTSPIRHAAARPHHASRENAGTGGRPV